MKKLLYIMLVLPVIIGLAACQPAAPPTSVATEAPPTEAPVAAGPEFIVIGNRAPIAGTFPGCGEGNTWGARAAVDDINAQGGIFVKEYNRKIPVKYVIADNQSDPQKAGPLAEDLILREKVHMLYSVDSPPSIP